MLGHDQAQPEESVKTVFPAKIGSSQQTRITYCQNGPTIRQILNLSSGYKHSAPNYTSCNKGLSASLMKIILGHDHGPALLASVKSAHSCSKAASL
jgi:hypothetical protein